MQRQPIESIETGMNSVVKCDWVRCGSQAVDGHPLAGEDKLIPLYTLIRYSHKSRNINVFKVYIE
jgi:hypothetical protein